MGFNGIRRALSALGRLRRLRPAGPPGGAPRPPALTEAMESRLLLAGTGLAATYYDNPDFTGASVQRTDATVDFRWRTKSPAPGLEPSTFSVRWEGQVEPRYAETYTFTATGNGGVRLWVNGQQLVDDWNTTRGGGRSGRVTLEAGHRYDVRMEYYQDNGKAAARLKWASRSQRRQVIASGQLYPAAAGVTPQPPAPPTPVPDPTPAPTPGPTPTSIPDLDNMSVPPLAGDWTMLWHDEFDGSALDPVWRTTQYWDNTRTIVGQGELEAYDASAVSVGGGMLSLTARKEEKYAGTPYVSGLVQTGGYDGVSGEPTFNFKYGYMEVRAKIPKGQGIWPAIWMMPASYNDGNGELDVLEVIGSEPNVANFSLHRSGGHNTDTWTGPDFSQDFHTYGVDWQPDHVSWYVDGVERARMTDPALICPEASYPILNVAVGGDWPGAPDSTTAFPATMQVDYVRVWQ